MYATQPSGGSGGESWGVWTLFLLQKIVLFLQNLGKISQFETLDPLSKISGFAPATNINKQEFKNPIVIAIDS